MLVRARVREAHLGVEEGFAPARKAPFLADDLADLVARLAATGRPTRADGALEGCDRLYVEDPFGNRVELVPRRRGGTVPPRTGTQAAGE